MTISNYGDLKSAVVNWLARGDMAPNAADFITLAHADFNRRFRFRQMESVETISPADDVYALPDDYLTYRSVISLANGRRWPLEAVSTDYLDVNCSDGVFAVSGSNIILPKAGPDIELRYYQRIPDLVNDADTNWLLTKEPGIYLYSALAHSAPFIGEDGRLPLWTQMAATIGTSLESENTLATRANGGARLKGPTP